MVTVRFRVRIRIIVRVTVNVENTILRILLHEQENYMRSTDVGLWLWFW
jgi:hypothetical protein